MLIFLGVSLSGYRSFLNRKLSPTRQRKETVKKEIQKIYDNSKQNYGAPKIAQELRKSGETISQRTVGKYMREMDIRAQWTKPWTTTTRDTECIKISHLSKSAWKMSILPHASLSLFDFIAISKVVPAHVLPRDLFRFSLYQTV